MGAVLRSCLRVLSGQARDQLRWSLTCGYVDRSAALTSSPAPKLLRFGVCPEGTVPKRSTPDARTARDVGGPESTELTIALTRALEVQAVCVGGLDPERGVVAGHPRLVLPGLHVHGLAGPPHLRGARYPGVVRSAGEGVQRATSARWSRSSVRSGDPANARRWPIWSGSQSTRTSRNSDARRPRNAGAGPGRDRTPTSVVPAANTCRSGPVRGPVNRGTDPRTQVSSTPPCGGSRWGRTGHRARYPGGRVWHR